MPPSKGPGASGQAHAPAHSAVLPAPGDHRGAAQGGRWDHQEDNQFSVVKNNMLVCFICNKNEANLAMAEVLLLDCMP